MLKKLLPIVVAFLAFSMIGCDPAPKGNGNAEKNDTTKTQDMEIQKKVDEYAVVKLTTDISQLTEKEKQMLPILTQVADIMDEIFWKEAYGNKEEFLNSLNSEAYKKFAMINYGPWDRLDGDKSFVEGIGEKPLGANFYPQDITKEEFEAFTAENKADQYSIIKRNAEGQLEVIPYHEAFKEQINKAAELLKQAAELAEDEGLKKYFELRVQALLTDDYLASDLAWMDMRTNTIDFVVGPIENYEDQFMGYRTAHSGQILVKDKVWSQKLERFAALLPELQNSLPVDAKYKQEKASADSDINAYDVIYYGGDCNAGGKNIAINLPNDERVHAQKGSRKLQLKNAMKAKFDKILIPISEVVICEEQRQHINFNAFFENTMFHEVAHGLGIKNTLDGKNTVRAALKEQYSAIEEGKADILGLFMVTKLYEMGELNEGNVMDNYVTFMAGLFRSIRFGASSAHGKANMIRFNYFQEKGAFTRDDATQTYKVDFEKMKEAMNSLSEMILVMQGDGNYEAAKKWVEEKGLIGETLQKDLDRIAAANIAKDIVFEQGLEVLGL